MTEGSHTEIPREDRFPLVVPLVYRLVREQAWHQGTTVNVSGTGALFMGQLDLEAGAPIELRLALSGAAPGVAPDCVRCTGRITRIAHAGTEVSRAMMAAQFDDFRFESSLAAQ